MLGTTTTLHFNAVSSFGVVITCTLERILLLSLTVTEININYAIKKTKEVGVSGGGAPTLLRTSQLPFVGTTRLV